MTPAIGERRLGDDAAYRGQHSPVMRVANLPPMLQLSNNDPWMNLHYVGEPLNPHGGKEWPQADDEILQRFLVDQGLASKPVRKLFGFGFGAGWLSALANQILVQTCTGGV